MSSCGLGVRFVDVTGGDALVSFSSSKCDINVTLRLIVVAESNCCSLVFVSLASELVGVKIESFAVVALLFVIKRNPLPLTV